MALTVDKLGNVVNKNLIISIEKIKNILQNHSKNIIQKRFKENYKNEF